MGFDSDPETVSEQSQKPPITPDSKNKIQEDRNCGSDGKKTITPEKLLEQFDPIPSQDVQKKIDYFFFPYSPKQDISKYMKFEADIEDQRAKMLQALIEASKNEKLSPREQKEIQDGINKIA